MSGISVITNITTSENRLWFKLDARYFGFKNDLFVCACYMPPTNSLYNNDDFTDLENEISSLNGKGNILIIGDLTARFLLKMSPDLLTPYNIYFPIITMKISIYTEIA